MIGTPNGFNRLPQPGAGFVWDSHGTSEGSLTVLRPTLGGVNAAFTTRLGGASSAPFDTLNVSFVVGDQEPVVRANRELAGSVISSGGRWSVSKQVHGGRVVRAEPPGTLPEADALWTDDRDQTVAVLAADCVPALVAADGLLAAVHAGWRGLIAGVVENAVGVVPGARVFAGPAIGPCCYEVGPDVARAFADRFGGEVCPDDRHVDLWIAAELSARRGGAVEVTSARLCTSCHPELFFSHRRDAGRTGRQALIARLADE